jgi:hypothetical protein
MVTDSRQVRVNFPAIAGVYVVMSCVQQPHERGGAGAAVINTSRQVVVAPRVSALGAILARSCRPGPGTGLAAPAGTAAGATAGVAIAAAR